jgi:predicted outer membrane repeat protein
MKERKTCRLLAAPLALAVTNCLAGGVVIAVDDSSEGSAAGHCTVRDAVAALNTMTAVQGCRAGDGASDDIIFLNFNTPTTITFTSAADSINAMLITQPVSIQAPTDSQGRPQVVLQRSTASGTADFRLIESHSTLALDGIVLRNGRTSGYGGAVDISNSSDLSISRCSVQANYAQQGGGGLHAAFGSITIVNSTVSDNSTAANGGGAAALNNNLTAMASTFSGNVSQASGGAIYAAGSANVTDSTISGNVAVSAGGGVWANHANMYFATVFGNISPVGGGVYSYYGGTIVGNIISGNGSDNVDTFAPYAMIGASNIIGPSNAAVPADTRDCAVKLGPLANFGGATATLPLQNSSCAIDTGPVSPSVSVDQRGQPRPSGMNADIGAFEKQGPGDPDYIFIDSFGIAGAD